MCKYWMVEKKARYWFLQYNLIHINLWAHTKVNTDLEHCKIMIAKYDMDEIQNLMKKDKYYFYYNNTVKIFKQDL